MGAVAQSPSVLAPKTGEPVGILQIDTPITLNVVIGQGVGTPQLRAGPGHEPGTPLPGALGNSVIYGHDAARWRTLRHAPEYYD